MKAKKKVRIELRHDSWAVIFTERKFRGRHHAACFYAKDTTRQEVIEWVKARSWLELDHESRDNEPQ